MSTVTKKFNKAYADSTGTRNLVSSPQVPQSLTSPSQLKNVSKATDIYEPWMEPTWQGSEMKPQPAVSVTELDSPPPENPETISRSRFKYNTAYSEPIAEDDAKKLQEQELQEPLERKQTTNAENIPADSDLDSNYLPAKRTPTAAVSANPKNKVKYASAVPMQPREDTNKEHAEFIEHESNAIALSTKAKPVVAGNPKNKMWPNVAPMERRYDPEPEFADDEANAKPLTPPPKRPPVVGNPRNRAAARAASMDTRYDPEPNFRSPTPPRTPTPPPKVKSVLKANPRNRSANKAASMDAQEDPLVEPPLTPPPPVPTPPVPRPLNKPRSSIFPNPGGLLERKEEPDVPQRKKAKKKKKPNVDQRPMTEARQVAPTKASAPHPPPPPQKSFPKSDSDESDYEPFHQWVMNGRDDDILPKHAHRLLFENKVKKKSRSRSKA